MKQTQSSLTLTDISLTNISFSYSHGEKMILDNISLSFPIHKRTALFAPSGWGKTTLLHLIAGLQKPDSGTIHIPFNKPTFSMVFQENRLLEASSIQRNLSLVKQQLSPEQMRSHLAAVGLSYPLKKKACELSGGEARRLSIVRALCADYDILLLDEPFTGLDEETKQQVITYVRQQTIGKTVILVTHNIEEAQSLDCEIITF